MGRGSTPHISLARHIDTGWEDLGRVLYDAERVRETDWVGGGPGWQKTKDGRLKRRYLGFVVRTTPKTHLDGVRQ